MLRRTTPDQLVISGPDVERLLAVACHPLEPRMMALTKPFIFTPAKRYVSALGALLREYVHPDAWIRLAAFSFAFDRVTLSGSADDLDWIAEQVEVMPPPSVPREAQSVSEEFEARLPVEMKPTVGSTPIEFRYSHVDADGFAQYRDADLTFITATELQELIERDAGDEDADGKHLFDIHEFSLEEVLSTWLTESLAADVTVGELLYSATAHGVAYDLQMPNYAHLRSPEEAPPEPSRPWWQRLRRGGRR